VEAPLELRRRISLPAAFALVVGGTIGVGIFLTPAGMATRLASPAWLLLVWAFMGGAALCGALCFGELAARFPQAGGGYVYLREAYGPLPAFLYGWKCLLVMDPGLSAALATGFGAYAQAAWPGLSPKTAAFVAIAAVAGANLAGVRLAWWEASKLAGEVREAQRTLPRALALGVVAVTLLYVAVSAVFVYLVPIEAVASSEAFAAQAGTALFGPAGGRALAALVALCVLGSLFAFMTMAPRVYYAMARDGAVPALVGRLDPRTGAPVRAIAIQATLAALLVALGTFDAIVAYFVFVTVAFLALTVAGLVRLRRSSPPAGYATPLYPLTPMLFLASVGLVLALLAGGRPREAALGVAVVALGIPVHRLLTRGQRAASAAFTP